MSRTRPCRCLCPTTEAISEHLFEPGHHRIRQQAADYIDIRNHAPHVRFWIRVEVISYDQFQSGPD